VTIPSTYSELPTITSPLPPKHHQLTFDDIITYFKEIRSGILRVVAINKLLLSDIGDSRHCDCGDCRSSGSILDETYYYCRDCNQDMCLSCYDKTDQHHSHILVKRHRPQLFYCDMCPNGNIIVGLHKYHGDGNYDMCLKCAQMESGQLMIKEKQLCMMDLNLACNTCSFGSLLDWVPLLSDDEGNKILFNANPKSDYHQQYALCTRVRHGVLYYYSLVKPTEINSLIDEVRESSIKEIMIKRNMKVPS
jgi:hypothetical protein